MKIVKISLVVLLAISSCGLSAMRVNGINFSSLRNEPSESNRPRETDQQRAQRLRLLREKSSPADFYDQKEIEAKAFENAAARKKNMSEYQDADGYTIDVEQQIAESEQQRVQEIDKAQLDAIQEAGESMDFAAKSRERNLFGKKIAGFATEMSSVVNAVERRISSMVRSNSKSLINADKADRVQVKALMDQATSLSEAIDSDLASGKKDAFGRRSEKDMNLIREKLEDLRMVQRDLNSIVEKLRTKNDRLKVEIPREIQSLRNRRGGFSGEIEEFIKDNSDLLTPTQVKELEELSSYSRERSREQNERSRETADYLQNIMDEYRKAGLDPLLAI